VIPLDIALPLLTITGSIGIVGASVALGIRHGIDWDHIAAITDITSTASVTVDPEEAWLVREPGVMLTDESHHAMTHTHEEETPSVSAVPVAVGADVHAHAHLHPESIGYGGDGPSRNGNMDRIGSFVKLQRPALLLGTMYALGHGSVVFALGMLAILAREFLPDWIDPVMERVVGVTLIFLAVYLFYSVYRFFRGGEEFQIRSRWMLVFAAVRNVYGGIRAKIFGQPHHHVHEAAQYGVRTAYGIGMIHGVGAETGTQVLVITTAVGASSQLMGIVALVAFLVGLLISNSIVTVVTTVGFISSRQRQWIYVLAGLFAAVFSLFVGTAFLLQSADILPDLDQYFSWIGGGS
jgi:high-affinity nickel-transport protein